MYIIKNIRRMKLLIKVSYYWALCHLLNPKALGRDPYEGYPFIRRLTEMIPGSKYSAVRLLIYGTVKDVGFSPWLFRRAKFNKLDCLAINRSKNILEAVMVGSSASIEILVQDAWKGPQNARVEKIETKWFNKPIVAGFREKSEKPDEYISWFHETADLLRQTINYLGPVIKQPNKFEVKSNHNNAGELERAAASRGLFVARFSNINYIASPGKDIGFQQSQSSRVSTITRSLTNNKQLTKDYLSGYKIAVPVGKLFTDLTKARAYLLACEYPIVVKPVEGSYGKGVSVGVKTTGDLDTAWQYARKYHEQVVLERMIQGVDIRILVIGGKSKAALLRVPAHVVGDGENKIKSLIDMKNKQRTSNPRLCKALIVPDINVELFLEKLGYSLDSIPEKDEVIFLNFKANIGAGADSIVITDDMHSDLLRLAEETASVLGIEDFLGVDMLVERIDYPRDKQICRVIEVNTRANIFNVQFPMYGQPYDAAQALIDYLFPETYPEQSYPAVGLRMIITGQFDGLFFGQICEQARALNIQGYIENLDSAAEIVASGKKINLDRFINGLWDWDSLMNGSVDRIKISQFYGEIEKGFYVTRGPAERLCLSNKEQADYNFGQESINIYEDFEWTGSVKKDLGLQLFINEFRRLGYEAKPLFEALLEIHKPGFSGITGMHFSSIFCDEVCDKLLPARAILSLKGLPVIRGIRFKPTEMKKALKYFNQLNQACIFNILYKDQTKSFSIMSKKDFMMEWQNAIKKGCSHLVIEEQKEGWNVCLAVVAGHYVGALLYKPVEIVGNGFSSIAELINNKKENRKSNPFYCDQAINIDQKLIKRLKPMDLKVDDIPTSGESIFLESAAGLELGGETVSFSHVLDESFETMAINAVAAIPGLDFAFVHMVIPYPDRPVEGQSWAVKKIETSPSVAAFHFPWKGKPCNIVQKVVAELCLTDRTRWVEEV